MRTLQSVIADNEPLARERLARLLQEAGCEVVAQLEDGKTLLAWLESNPPIDVAFIDIQMPGLSGMEVVAELQDPPPVVFVTAHPEFAVQSYEVPAMDFLVKPVYPERLGKTLERVRTRRNDRTPLADTKAAQTPLQRVAIKAGTGTVYLDLRMFSHFEFRAGVVLAVQGTHEHPTRWLHLTDVEKAFPGAGLMRINRNLLLRPEAVVGSRSSQGGRLKVRVADKLELTASLSMTPLLKARLGHR